MTAEVAAHARGGRRAVTLHWSVKPAVFVLCLVPLALLVWNAFHDALGANPVETIRRDTGIWTLRLLWITLAVTPLRVLSGWQALQRLRRMLGLFAFFYACLHVLSYAWLEQGWSLSAMIEDVIDRPYITIGLLAFLLLLPLAATSTNAMMRRLGGRRWQRLHRLVYVAALAGLVHFLWLVKSDLSRPVIYGAVLALLLGFRMWRVARRRAAPL